MLSILLGLTGGRSRAQQPAAEQPAPAPKARPKEVRLSEKLHSPYEADRPITSKLRSPRETLKTLYFAAATFDFFPDMLQDAVACLDLEALPARPAAEDAAMMALDLDGILQTLALPLNGIPDGEGGERFDLYDADGLKLVLRRATDGGWRFSAETLTQLPQMRRAVRAKSSRRSTAELAGLKEGMTDPRATFRQFHLDAAHGDFYAAARALDLSSLGSEERREQGPVLAQQLAFVCQRLSYLFRQEVPDQPDGPAYTWHMSRQGRVVLDRVRQPDGKDAWLFTRQTVRGIPRLYAALQDAPPDARYVRMGMLVPAVAAEGATTVRKRPDDIPAHLGSPRALLQGFLRTMAAAEANDARLSDALEFLDLKNVPTADRLTLGGKLAAKLQAVLRKLPIDLGAIPDDWNASPQVLGEGQGVRVEILRQRDGCWCFSAATVAALPELFDKLAGKTRDEAGRGEHLDSARDTTVTFLEAARRRKFTQAARCLNLGEVPASARDEVGPVLALKLLYVLDRIGRLYVEEVPDAADGPRCILYRGELGRVVLDRGTDDRTKNDWLFTPETVRQIEPMFRAVVGRAAEEAESDVRVEPRVWDTPGPWLRLRLPELLQTQAGPLDLYQWPGLALALLASWAGAWVTMKAVSRLVVWLLRRSGSVLSSRFVTKALRPFTWLAAVSCFFLLLQVLDLRLAVTASLFAAEKFILTALFGWLGFRLLDLSLAIYTNSELLRPHRSLGDMVVPVSVRLGKAVLLLAVTTYLIYQIGEFDLLGRFLTGLGVAGLAASLAAQDAMKSYFGTLLLIGEQAFKIGDRIDIGDKRGVVEQVGFRSTRLRTAADSVLTIPNSVIASAAIENLGTPTRQSLTAVIAVAAGATDDRVHEFRDRFHEWLVGQGPVVGETVDLALGEDGTRLNLTLSLIAKMPADEARFCESLRREAVRLGGTLGLSVAPVFPEPAWEDDEQANLLWQVPPAPEAEQRRAS